MQDEATASEVASLSNGYADTRENALIEHISKVYLDEAEIAQEAPEHA